MTLQVGPVHTRREMAAAARSYIYNLLAGGFSFPTTERTAMFASGQWLVDLSTLTSQLPYALRLEEATQLTGESCTDGMEEAYISMFEVGPGGPFCALYEGSHRQGRMKIMEDLVRFYEHFGLQPEPGDQPDHLCAELEFMHYLCFKETAGLSRGVAIEGLPSAQRDFLSRHLCRWLPRLHSRISSASAPPPFYTALASLAKRFCEHDWAWLKSVGKSPTQQSGSCPTDGAEGNRR